MHLMDKLNQIINESTSDRMEYWFADFVKSHFDQVGEMTIEDLAKSCQTSTSSISRLINQFGYENYKAFRHDCAYNAKALKQHMILSQDVSPLHLTPGNIDHYFNQRLLSFLKAIQKKDIEFVRDVFDYYPKIYLISMVSMNIVTQHIQLSLSYTHREKVIIIVNDYTQLASLSKEDCVIVFSNTGNIFKGENRVGRHLLHCQAYKLLLSAVEDPSLTYLFNHCIPVFKNAAQPQSLANSQIYVHLMFFFIEMVLTS